MRVSTASAASTPTLNRSTPRTSGTLDEYLTHPFSRHDRVFVLPYADRRPTLGSESRLDLSVSLHVSCELGLPVGAVHPRHVRVLRAAVPEAAVDEDGETRAGEGDVNSYRPPARDSDRIVAAEAEPGAVKGRAESELGPSVPLSVALHDRGRRRRGGMGIPRRVLVRVRATPGGETGYR